MRQLSPFVPSQPIQGTQYRSEPRSTSAPAPAPAPASSTPERAAVSFDPEQLLDSIEPPSPSPASGITLPVATTVKNTREFGKRLADSNRLGTAESGDHNQAIHAWIEGCKEEETVKQKKKKSADETLSDADAARADRDKMKRFISQKRPREHDSSSEGISGEEEPNDSSPSTTDLPTEASRSPTHTSSLPRLRKRQKRSLKKYAPRNDFKPFFDALTSGVTSLIRHALVNKAINERLSRIEARQVEILAMVQRIADKQSNTS